MDDYPTDFVSIGTVENVYTTHVTHQEQFFIHLDTRSSILEEIMDKLEIRYSQLEPNDKTLPSHQIKLGGLCAAKFTDDNNWYRVKITGLLNNGLIEVNFVDYGNTDYVSADRVKKLDPDLMQYPVQSYKCALAGVSCQHGQWTPELRVQFEDLVIDKQCRAVFTGKSHEDVYLLDMYDESGIHINHLFGATEKPRIAADSKAPRNGSHGDPGFGTVEWKQGQKVHASVVYVTSPDVFYCQEVVKMNDILVLSEELSRLHMTQQIGPLQDMRPGTICAAKFHEDEAWYRGIIQSLSRNQAQVYFVDYGNTETVGINSICELKPQFRVLPALGVKCSISSLRGSEGDGGKWSPEATEAFEKFVVDKEFELCVLGKRHDGYDVSLLDIEENKDVGNQFKEILRSGIKARTPPKADNTNNSSQTISKNLGLDLSIGSTTDVFLSWIDNPADFWVQVDAASDVLEKLSSDLQEYYSQPRPVALSAPGAFVIARFSEDQQWYRGLVVKEFDDLVKVLFIDYGNADTIPKSEVRQVNPQFGQIDPLAFRCSLKGIKPLPQDNSWSVDAKDFLEKLTENGCKCEVLSKNDAYRFVNLKVDGKDVTQELVSLAVVAGSLPSPGKSTLQSYLPSPRLHENQTEDVLVTHIDSPHSFWVQLNKTSADLDAVMEKLDNHYSEEGGTPVGRPAVGQACVAQYSLDNAWYRAVITNVTPSGCNVHFVDYGNAEVVAPNLVCVAEPRFLDLPSQAIKCRLPFPGDVSSLTDTFSDLVLEKDVSLKVVAGGEIPTVDLTVEGQSVCSSLRNPNGHGISHTPAQSGPSGLKPAKSIPQGSMVQAFTSMVHNPGRFFLQLSGVDDELSTLMDQISERYASPGVSVVSQPSVGMHCVALYQDDNQWYRGKIVSTHGDQYQVLFVDYGNEEFVDKGSVKVLTPEVSTTPILAYECSLHGVSTGEWSESSIEFFESVVMEQELSCTFITPSTVTITCNGEDVAQKMISSGHCQRAGGAGPKSPLSVSTQSGFGSASPQKSPGFGQNQNSPGGFGGKRESRGFGEQREEKRSFGGDKSKGNFGESKGFGGERQEGRGFGGGGGRKFGGDDSGSHRSDEGSERGGYKSKSRDESDSGFGGRRGGGDGGSGFGGGRRERNTDSSAVSVDKFVYADPPSGPESAILVHIDDDGTFYLQLPSMEKDILFLSKRLAGSYKSGGPRLKGMAEKGTICCCKFPDDGSMYRCQVEGIDGNKVLVRYMDFGNTAEHSTFDLKFMFPDLLQYPAQAFPCKLRGFDWSLDKADTFGIATLDKDLEVTFTSTTPPFLVDIKTPDGDLLSIMTGKIAPPTAKISSPKKSPSSQGGGMAGGFGAKSTKGFGSSGGMDASTSRPALNLSPAKPAVPKQVFLSQTAPSDSQTAFISHISEDGYFYLQFEKDTTILESLTEKLTNLNSNTPHPDLCKGAACAAIFSEDSAWYRAKISEVDGDQFSVTFVDFGNGDKVAKENIRPLSQDLLSSAPLAYQCKFEGDDETLSEKSIEKLEEFLLEHQVTVSFCSQSAPFAITATTSDGQDLHEIVNPSNRYRSFVIPKDVSPAGVCHIEEDGRIFICLYQKYKAKDKLQKSLQDHYATAEVKPVENPEVDCPCCIKSPSNDLWHRGCIKSIKDSTAEVQYVDIGKVESFEAAGLQTLDSKFLKDSPFALECRLKGVDSWTDDLKEKFINMTEDKILNATFYTTSIPYRVSLARSIELDLLGLSAPQPDSPRKRVDEAAISKANLNRTTVFQGGDAYITEITTQGIFFAQLVSEEEQLQTLSDSLDSLLTSEQIEPDTVEEGNLVCAKFSEDDVWYRATVEGVDDEKFTVRFVDYGNTDTVCKDRLASLPDEISTTSIPAFAYQCKLSTPVSDVEEFKASVLDKMVCIQVVSAEDDGIFNVDVTLDGLPVLSSQEPATAEEGIENQEQNTNSGSTERTTVIVPFVTTPCQFYVQRQSEESQLDSMMNDLYEDLTALTEGEGHVPDNLAVGDLCAALYDESWYRVRVVSFGEEDQSAQVLYADHGNTETVARSELYTLPDKYKSLPLFGHEATLPGIKPVDGDWTEEAIASFKGLVEEKALLADLLATCDDKPWVVQLLDMGAPVQDTLIANGHGLATEISTFSSSNKQVFAEDSESGLNMVDNSESTEDKTLKRNLGCVSNKLEELKEVNVFVSHVDNPSQMWCQLASSTEELEELADKMETLYSTIQDSDRISGDIDADDLVVGLFDDDGMRYRSIVVNAEASNREKILLRFVDYGNCGSCARSDILRLRDELCNQPAFSFSCSLDKVQPLEEGDWSPEVCSRLTELTTDQELLLTLVGRKQDGTALVDLIEVESGKSLSDTLIEEGLVKSLDEESSLGSVKHDEVKDVLEECLEITQPIMESTAVADEPNGSISQEEQNFQHYSIGLAEDGSFRVFELNVHSSYVVTVCNDELPNAFCVHLKDYADKRHNFFDEIQQYVNNNPDTGRTPKIGDKCLVKHENAWQRAIVRTETDAETYIVWAVDIGWELQVTATQMREIPDQFLDFPGQAIQVYLAGVVSKEPEWTAEAILFFNDYVRHHEFIINVQESAEDGKYGVSMTGHVENSPVEFTGSDLNQMMVELGFSDVVPGSNIAVQYDMERALDTEMVGELEESFKELEKNIESRMKSDASSSQVDTFLTTYEEERMTSKIPLEVGSKFYHLVHMSQSEKEERSLIQDEKCADGELSVRVFDIASAVDRIDKMGCIDLFPEDSFPFDLNSDVDSVLLEVSKQDGTFVDVQANGEKSEKKCNGYCESAASRLENKSPLYTWSQSISPDKCESSLVNVDDTGDSNNNDEDKISAYDTHDIDKTGDGTHRSLDTYKNGPVHVRDGSSTDYSEDETDSDERKEIGELVESFEVLSIGEEEKQLLPYEYYERLESKEGSLANAGSCNEIDEIDNIQRDKQISADESESYAPINHSGLNKYVKSEGLDSVNEDVIKNGVDKIVNGESQYVYDQHCIAESTEVKNGMDNVDFSIDNSDNFETSTFDEDINYITIDQTGSIGDEEDFVVENHATNEVSASSVTESECTQNMREDAADGCDMTENDSAERFGDLVFPCSVFDTAAVCNEITKVISVDSSRNEINETVDISQEKAISNCLDTVTIGLKETDHSGINEPKYPEPNEDKNDVTNGCVIVDDESNVLYIPSCEEMKTGIEIESVTSTSENSGCNMKEYCEEELTKSTCTEKRNLKDKVIADMKCDLNDKGNGKDVKEIGSGSTYSQNASPDSASVERSMFESCLEPALNGMDSSGSRHEGEAEVSAVTTGEFNIAVQETKLDRDVISDTNNDYGCAEATPSIADEEDEEDALVTSFSTLDDTYDNYESASETFNDTDLTDSFYNSSANLVIDEVEIDSSAIDSSCCGPDSSSCYDYDTSSLVFSDSQLESSYADTTNTSISTRSTELSSYSVTDISSTYDNASTCTFEDTDLTAEEDTASSLSTESTSSMVKRSSINKSEEKEALTYDSNPVEIKETEQGNNEISDIGQMLSDDGKGCFSGPSVESSNMTLLHCSKASQEEEKVKLKCEESIKNADKESYHKAGEEMAGNTTKCIPSPSTSDKIVKRITERESSADSDHSAPASFHSADSEEEIIGGNLEESALTTEEDNESNTEDDKVENANDVERDEACTSGLTGNDAPQESIVTEDVRGKEQQLEDVDDNDLKEDGDGDEKASDEKNDDDEELKPKEDKKSETVISEDKEESEA